jgi:hypothetical protein
VIAGLADGAGFRSGGRGAAGREGARRGPARHDAAARGGAGVAHLAGRRRRPPALIRFWPRQKLLRTPVPLTGVAALRPGPVGSGCLALGFELDLGISLDEVGHLAAQADFQHGGTAERGQRQYRVAIGPPSH